MSITRTSIHIDDETKTTIEHWTDKDRYTVHFGSSGEAVMFLESRKIALCFARVYNVKIRTIKE